MSKYIDADRLKELLDAKYKEFTEKAKKDCPLQYQYMADGLDIAEQFIDSLQQEQPEVDLENEIDACWQNWLSPSNQNEVEGVLPKTEFAAYARHFYNHRNRAREEAARRVYESWMGGTINDVRRDMVVLGKVLNATAEDEQ